MGTRCIYIDQSLLRDIVHCWLAGDLSSPEYKTNFPANGKVIDVFAADGLGGTSGKFCVVAKSDEFTFDSDEDDEFVVTFTQQEPR